MRGSTPIRIVRSESLVHLERALPVAQPLVDLRQAQYDLVRVLAPSQRVGAAECFEGDLPLHLAVGGVAVVDLAEAMVAVAGAPALGPLADHFEVAAQTFVALAGVVGGDRALKFDFGF